MSTGAWVMLVVGTIITIGGLTACLLVSMLRQKNVEPK